MTSRLKEGETLHFEGQEYIATTINYNTQGCKDCALDGKCHYKVECVRLIFLTPLDYIIQRLKKS